MSSWTATGLLDSHWKGPGLLDSHWPVVSNMFHLCCLALQSKYPEVAVVFAPLVQKFLHSPPPWIRQRKHSRSRMQFSSSLIDWAHKLTTGTIGVHAVFLFCCLTNKVGFYATMFALFMFEAFFWQIRIK